MITLNLLPDIKKEYLRSQRKKRIFLLVAFVVTVSSVAVVVLVAMYVFGVQKLQIVSSQNRIDSSIKTLNETPDLAKIVTIQNQLLALPSLHESKSATTRIFDYLKVLTPVDVNLNSVTIDFEGSKIEIKGSGKDFKSVNTFVDTLKNATYVYSEHTEATLAFSDVVLGTISKDSKVSSFKVTFSYDPLIFDNTVTGLKLTVPNITSTRSETEKPKSLFDSTDLEENK